MNKHWLDNADSYLCPECGFEVNNPAKVNLTCPRCGFIEKKGSDMAKLSNIEVTMQLRPCLVKSEKNTVKGLFHCWCNEAYIVTPSPLVHGHGGGQFWNTFGVVEMEDGMIKEVPPYSIQFLDPHHEEYEWSNTQDSK